jgi:hypothetical protein
MMMPPLNWLAAVFPLRMRPQSNEPRNRLIRSWGSVTSQSDHLRLKYQAGLMYLQLWKVARPVRVMPAGFSLRAA